MARQYKAARKSQNLTLKDAAAKLGVSPSTLGAWEAERKSPSIESLESMAELYRVSTDYLLGKGVPTDSGSLPLSQETLNLYHGKPVWSPELGWMLVNSVTEELLCFDGTAIAFKDAGSLYAAQPPFYEAQIPDAKPLSKQELGNYNTVWVEPVSQDTVIREHLRGWYRVCDQWVENEQGTRFPISTYGAKWLAFHTK